MRVEGNFSSCGFRFFLKREGVLEDGGNYNRRKAHHGNAKERGADKRQIVSARPQRVLEQFKDIAHMSEQQWAVSCVSIPL
jgi:hypothetical protein